MTVVKTIFSFSLLCLSLVLASCGGGGTPADDGGNSGSSTGTVPDSGQASCYYDYIDDGVYIPLESYCLSPGSAWKPDGQDGYHTINTMSFTDNSDGTILDNVTRLTWQKCTFGETGTDCSGGASTLSTWSEAMSQCTNLNLVGTGWRLPTILELAQIVDYGKSFAIDTTMFSATGYPYWSSTTHASVTSGAWYVYFIQSGITWANYKTEIYSVRCVRG